MRRYLIEPEQAGIEPALKLAGDHLLLFVPNGMPLVNLLPEPPTHSSRVEAQKSLEIHRRSIDSLNNAIRSAEEELAQIVSKSQLAIYHLNEKKQSVENEINLTLAYISPIRTLPQELLRHIFMLNFEDHPCCAWTLARVCVAWRKLVLSIPTLWSKVYTVPFWLIDPLQCGFPLMSC
jgi:F-box-like